MTVDNWQWQLEKSIIVVQSPSHVWLFGTPWTAAHQTSLSFTISRSLPKFISNELVMTSNHLILCHPLLPSIFLSIRVFSNELAFHISWAKYWKSHTRAEKDCCLSSGSKPHPCSQIWWISFSSFQIPPFYLNSPTFKESWFEKLTCQPCLSILWPLNTACCVPVSASVLFLAAWIWAKKKKKKNLPG